MIFPDNFVNGFSHFPPLVTIQQQQCFIDTPSPGKARPYKQDLKEGNNLALLFLPSLREFSPLAQVQFTEVQETATGEGCLGCAQAHKCPLDLVFNPVG